MPIQRGRYAPAQQWAQTATLTPTVPLRRPTPTPGPTPVPGPTPTSPADYWAARAMMSGQATPGMGGGTTSPQAAMGAGGAVGGRVRPSPTGGGIWEWIQKLFGQTPEAIPGGLDPYRSQQTGAMPPGVQGAASPTTGMRITWRQKPQQEWTMNDWMEFEKYKQDQANEMNEYQIATIANQQAQLSQAWAIAQMNLTQSQAEAAQQAQQAQAQLAQRKREMGAQIGTGIAGMQSQQWAQGLSYQLPKGTMFAPGFGPGGPMSEMARRAGVSYMPPRIPAAPPPSRREMEQWIADAIAKFGG